MNDIATLPVSNSKVNQTVASTAPGVAAKGLTFGEILSELNPLQYLPVIGTIYRAITGDVIPKPLREAGSVLVSGLIGGPIGVATSLATMAFERLTGIDFENAEQNLLAAVGVGHSGAPLGSPPASATVAAAVSPLAPVTHTGPWTATQLAAYGVVTLRDGSLRQGDLTGADVLNALQARTNETSGFDS